MDVPPEHRQWMYNRMYPNRVGLKDDFVKGVDEFVAHACQIMPSYSSQGQVRCPCAKCKCKRFEVPDDVVKVHLYKNGFKDNYYWWTSHGEKFPDSEEDSKEQCNTQKMKRSSIDALSIAPNNDASQEDKVKEIVHQSTPLGVPEHRKWMYNRVTPDRRAFTDEFLKGLDEFVAHACQLQCFLSQGGIRCPCTKCKCKRFEIIDVVKVHLCKNGFRPDYYWWTCHGETSPEPLPLLYPPLEEQANWHRGSSKMKKRRIDAPASHKDKIEEIIPKNG